jgi:hypothetical protein
VLFRSLYAVASNIAYLNKDIEFDTLLKYLIIQNNLKLVQPLPNQIIINITKSVYSKMVDGTLKPFQKKKRSILFNSKTSMSKNEKLEISRTLLAEKRRNESISKIEETINNWNFDEQGKISIRKISKISNMSKTTIQKYINHFEISNESVPLQCNSNNILHRPGTVDETYSLGPVEDNNESVPLQCNSNNILHRPGTFKDTSIYDSYKLTNVDEIKRFVKDNNLQWKYSTPRDFVLNPSYMSKSNFDKAKILLLSI